MKMLLSAWGPRCTQHFICKLECNWKFKWRHNLVARKEEFLLSSCSLLIQESEVLQRKNGASSRDRWLSSLFPSNSNPSSAVAALCDFSGCGCLYRWNKTTEHCNSGMTSFQMPFPGESGCDYQRPKHFPCFVVGWLCLNLSNTDQSLLSRWVKLLKPLLIIMLEGRGGGLSERKCPY